MVRGEGRTRSVEPVSTWTSYVFWEEPEPTVSGIVYILEGGPSVTAEDWKAVHERNAKQRATMRAHCLHHPSASAHTPARLQELGKKTTHADQKPSPTSFKSTTAPSIFPAPSSLARIFPFARQSAGVFAPSCPSLGWTTTIVWRKSEGVWNRRRSQRKLRVCVIYDTG